MTIRIRRIYEPVSPDDGARVLVDRVWPRGVRKADAALDRWAKDVTPSTDLRKWFGHDPARFDEFAAAYRNELDGRPEAVAQLVELALDRDLTLLYAARDPDCNHARILAEYLREHSASGT